MPELNEEEWARWEEFQPGKRIPGSPEPIEGHCNAVLNKQNKGLRDLDIQTLRYCTKAMGWGTEHPEYGNCKYHLGSTKKQEIAAVEKQVTSLVQRRREVMENPPPLRHWTIELELMGRQTKAWMSVVNDEMLRLETLFTTTREGKEEERALINTAREAGRDFMDILKYVSKMDLAAKRLELEIEQAIAITDAVKRAVLDSEIGLTDVQVAMIRRNLEDELAKAAPDLKNKDFIDMEPLDDDDGTW